MTVNSDGPSPQAGDKWFVRIMCKDGTQFEMPAVPNIDVTQYMSNIKALGFLGTAGWYVPYDTILWVARVMYRDNNVVPIERMTLQ